MRSSYTTYKWKCLSTDRKSKKEQARGRGKKKNEWNYTSTSLICLYGMDRDNFTDDSDLEIAILTGCTSRDNGSK